MIPEVVYTTSHEPDCGDALTVLAFVLMPDRSFADCDEELDAVRAVIAPARAAAVAEWLRLNPKVSR